MFPVIQHGWLFLLLCVGIVLLLLGLVGCASINSRTIATDSPLITLTTVPFSLNIVPPDLTDRVIQHEFTIPPPGWSTTRTYTGTRSDDPQCYDSPNQGYLCLGQIWNFTPDTLSNIIVEVALINDNGQVITEQSITLEQRTILPETSAPYRAHFQQINTNSPSASARLSHAETVSDYVSPIQVEDERGNLAESGRYVVDARLHNTGKEIAKQISMIVTVMDAEARVVGYRVQSIDPIMAGGQREVHLEVIPHITETELHHLLTVELLDRD